MKKFALYIVLAILLLSLGNNIKPTEENAGLGSDPGNILSGGDVAEDEEFIYYAATKGDKNIYKAKKIFRKIRKSEQ